MKYIADIISAIRNTLGPGEHALHSPSFQGNESDYLLECLESTYVSSVGTFVSRFENELENFTGSKKAVATVNGTAALQIALKLVGVGINDEVICPSLTFVGTANAIKHLHGIPHFVDVEERTLGMDPEALRSWLDYTAEVTSLGCRNKFSDNQIKAIVPMHTFGHSCDIDGLLAVAHDYKLTVIEDAAESLGSLFNGKHTGTFGKLGVLSFNGNKTITTGGGGAILTDDCDLAKYARHLTTTAKEPHPWEFVHNEVGYNFRMPNLNAALGFAQLEQLSGFIENKRLLFEKYQHSFSKLSFLEIFSEPSGAHSNYWLQAILLNPNKKQYRDDILRTTNEAGLMTRPIWNPLHTLQPFQTSPKAELPVTSDLAARIINIPSSAHLIQS